MLWACVLAASPFESISRRLEVTTANLAGGKPALDNVKAVVGTTFKLGGQSTYVRGVYDRSVADRKPWHQSLKEIRVAGGLFSTDTFALGYTVARDFFTGSTDGMLLGTASGTQLVAEYGSGQLQALKAERRMSIAEKAMSVNADWLLPAKQATMKLTCPLDSSSTVAGRVDYTTSGGVAGYEVGYSRFLSPARKLSAALAADKKRLQVQYVDTALEKGPAWTATADVELEPTAGTLLDTARFKLKRSWAW